MDIDDILSIVVYSVPVYSSVTCVALMMLTYRDSISLSESRLKYLLIFYYIFASFIWLGTIAFHFSQALFIYLNPFFYVSLLLASVTLYHFIYYLTAITKNKQFSIWHYFPPLVIFLIIFIWSLFIPYDTQYTIVSGKDIIIPEYKYYSIFYISKHTLRIVCLTIYISLSVHRLYNYSKVVISHNGTEYKKYIFWLWYILGVSIVLILASIITALSPYTHIHKFISNVFIVLLIATAHAVLIYNILRRNYYIIFLEKKVSLEQDNQIPNQNTDLSVSTKTITPRKQYVRYQQKLNNKESTAGNNLTKKQFELYFKEYKPYLNPYFRITDLIEPFEVNRTYISRFVNKEYGVNFSRYVNRCRLQKLEVLMALPSGKGKSIQDLLKLAGFGSYRSYMRAKLIEEEMVTKNKKK